MITIIIPAKGDSTRLPNKNMAPINGRLMIDYVIDDACACGRKLPVFVSTDSNSIADHAKSRGVAVIRRPTSLGGDVPIIEVYRHAIDELPFKSEVTAVVGLQVDHPDRNVSVDDALARFEFERADLLSSTEADGTKNGAHYIMSRHYLDTGESRHSVQIVDDCTNIHVAEELERAAARLANRSG